MHVKIIFLTAMGFLLLGMAAVGLLLPIWPTTPFVLLSIACFSSTPRIKAQIMKISFFREHIENYESRNGLSPKTTRISLIWLWGMLLLSGVVTRNIRIAALLSVVGIIVTAHILWMARKPK